MRVFRLCEITAVYVYPGVTTPRQVGEIQYNVVSQPIKISKRMFFGCSPRTIVF